MSNNRFINRQNSSSMDLENTGPASFGENPDPRLEELRIRREKTSENRISESELAAFNEEGMGNMNQLQCPFCQNSIIINTYNQHLVECPRRPVTEIQIVPPVSQQNDSTNTDNNENQLVARRPNTTRRAGRRLNIVNIPRSPLLLPSQSEELPNIPRNTFPLFTNILGNFTVPQVQNSPLSITQDPSSETQVPTTESQADPAPTTQDTLESELERFPQGAMIIRTVQPGPNGSTTVMVRIIPINEIFGSLSNANNGEGGNGPEGLGLLGALIGILSGTQGGRFFNMGNLFNMFQEERGLEKEVLDSLPVVTYNEESFKNVEEESKKCSICLDHFEEGNEVRYLWCIHRFHKNCVDTWLDKHTNCPICKKDYSELEKTNFE